MHKVRFAIIPLALIAGTALAACTQSGSSTPPTAASPLGSRHGWLSPAAKAQPIVYVSDYYANAIEIYPQGIDNPAPIGEITAGISGPLGNFVGPDGTLYVANTSNNTVTEYPKGSTSPSVTLSNGLNGPISVAADRRGNVAVGEFAAGDILEFPKGGSSPTVTIPLSYPEGLAFDRSNHLYAAWNVGSRSALSGDVSRCVKMEAICNDQDIKEGQSGGLALDKAGDIVLGDITNGVVNVYLRHSSTPSRIISMTGHAPYKFEFDKAEKNLYVADIDTGHVLVYDYASGSQVATISQGLESAWGVSLSPAAKDGK